MHSFTYTFPPVADAGANAALADEDGYTAADIAGNEGHSELAALLAPREPP